MAKKKINKNSIKDWTGYKCTYVWKIEWISRIVLYEGIILDDLWDKVRCSMVDKYIHVSDDLFEITLPKKKVNITT